MDLLFYPNLGTRSKRALTRRYTASGSRKATAVYRPKGTLLNRLARESGMTIDQVHHQLQKERQYLLSQDSLSL